MGWFVGEKGCEGSGEKPEPGDIFPDPSSSKSGWSNRTVSDFFFADLGLGSRCFMPHLASVEGWEESVAGAGELMLALLMIVLERPPFTTIFWSVR